MAFAVVYKENDEWLLYQNNDGSAAVFFTMSSATEYLNKVFKRIDYKLDGSPERYYNFFRSYIKRKEVLAEYRETLLKKKLTSCIKQIDTLQFTDSTKLKGSK